MTRDVPDKTADRPLRPDDRKGLSSPTSAQTRRWSWRAACPDAPTCASWRGWCHACPAPFRTSGTWR